MYVNKQGGTSDHTICFCCVSQSVVTGGRHTVNRELARGSLAPLSLGQGVSFNEGGGGSY